MARMATAPSTTDEAHEAEVATQAEIEAEVPAETVIEPTPDVVVDEQSKVKLVPTDAIAAYPARVSLVGLEEEIVFTGPSDSAEVLPAVAEQVAYVPGVEVAE